MNLQQAKDKSELIRLTLEPVCLRVMVCGSIRRNKPDDIDDIDIVCIPQRDVEKDLFGTIIGHPVIPEFIANINRWQKLKGEPTGKYTQRLVDGIKVEISICTPENFGCIQIIRTGDAEFTQKLMIRARQLGFEQRDGYLFNDEKMIPMPDEKEYFRVLNLPFIEPEYRNAYAFRNVSA